MTVQARSNITLQEKNSIEADLKSKGFRKMAGTATLSTRQYKISSFSGNAEAFGDDLKFNIEWCE